MTYANSWKQPENDANKYENNGANCLDLNDAEDNQISIVTLYSPRTIFIAIVLIPSK